MSWARRLRDRIKREGDGVRGSHSAWLGLPRFEEHLELLAHDRRQGGREPLLGERFHWARAWVAQRQRQWWGPEALVIGANPWLGAIRAAGLARSGKQTLWVYGEWPDAWDCALARKGLHAGELERAGLPGGGRALFEALAGECGGRLTMAWDRRVGYMSGRVAFVERAPARRVPSAQGEIAGWLREAFRELPRVEALPKSRRWGGGERDGVVFFETAALVSDMLDGAARDERESHCEASSTRELERWGSAAWSTGNAAVFAEKSRQDTRMALERGGWVK